MSRWQTLSDTSRAKFALCEDTLRVEAWVVVMVFSIKKRISVEFRGQDENYGRTGRAGTNALVC